ncbi:MAG: hypothetical protein LWY06_04890, partial [Firmicutes bacterium]|nr:hypothetical protein [Bacillota bacterium]
LGFKQQVIVTGSKNSSTFRTNYVLGFGLLGFKQNRFTHHQVSKSFFSSQVYDPVCLFQDNGFASSINANDYLGWLVDYSGFIYDMKYYRPRMVTEIE